ncbi:hypothetical protein RF11_02141 [Thelohanellus kitauei]|uniref:Uncharacterized protein n=1 Tax=Thelohanellus kitauei TaxID=669202 RepID=A0A0C2M0V9_THEKT|nr:hypothetical protein RF11_02141 [Thelohanellus kitauei]
MKDTDIRTKYLSVKEFKIKLTCISDNIKLVYTPNIHINTDKDVPFVLSIRRLNETEKEYRDEAEVICQVDHYFLVTTKACAIDVIILISIGLAVIVVVTGITLPILLV